MGVPALVGVAGPWPIGEPVWIGAWGPEVERIGGPGAVIDEGVDGWPGCACI